MRLLFLTQVAPAYRTDFYDRHPDLVSASFADQYAAVMRDAFAWVGAWSGAMGRAGHDVLEVVANASPMQRAWAREHGVRPTGPSARLSVAEAQIRAFRPDVVLVDDMRNFSADWLRALRERVPEIRCIVAHVGSPWHDVDTIRACDAVLCVSRAYTEMMRRHGCRSHFFRHAFNRDILRNLPGVARPSGAITFCGNFLRGAGAHDAREQLFEHLVGRVPVEIHAPQYGKSRLADFADTMARRALYASCGVLAAAGVSRTALRRLPVIGKAATWSSLPLFQTNARLRPYMRPALYGSPMYNALASASVTVHVHGSAAGDEAVAMRLFEATGVGGCLLTDRQSDLATVFAPDTEVVAFGSPAEALERAQWLLEHEEARNEIAAAGQRRTLREHTFDDRVAQFEEVTALAVGGRIA